MAFSFKGRSPSSVTPVGAEVVEVAPELTDWGQTAAALSQMDLVIAVDCSLSHLAAALNLPVWIPLQAAVELALGYREPDDAVVSFGPAVSSAARPRVGAGVRTDGGCSAELVARGRVEAA